MPSPAKHDRDGSPSAHDGVDVGHEINDTLSSLLPWGISILLHAGVVLIAVFAVYTVAETGTDNDAPIVPGSYFTENPRIDFDTDSKGMNFGEVQVAAYPARTVNRPTAASVENVLGGLRGGKSQGG